LNVRTYVTLGGKPGVYFFSLDAASTVAVAAARALFQLPYFAADMSVDVSGADVHYTSTRSTAGPAPQPQATRDSSSEPVATLVARYRPVGPLHNASPGTLEYFLTERYCLYNVDASFRARRLDIHHPPWPLQVAEAHIEVNTMAEAVGIALPPRPPLLHFARRQDMVAFPITGV
jgi:uncharacterized protein YqjF (DUF2071 family)